MGTDKTTNPLVKLLLNPHVAREKSTFADIDVNDLQNKQRTKKMFESLKGWTVETKKLKEDLKI